MEPGAKVYDAIVIGSGSGLELANGILQNNPGAKVAVIDKDDPGGICLTRGCIPSKLLLYPADLVRTIGRAELFGITVDLKRLDFGKVMDRMRTIVSTDVEEIRRGLTSASNVDYYPEVAEFTAPYTLSVAGQIITAQKIFLCTGSRPAVPSVEGLAEAGYLTSDTLLSLKKLPKSLVIIGGGYIAAEYGHFFAAMGSRVTIIGRNPQFIPEEEPEISAAAVRELGRHLTILTNHEVRRVEVRPRSGKKVVAFNRTEGREVEITAEEILVASGRSPNSDLLHPERSGIATDDKGWIVVNEYMETTQPGVWALGDADGKYLFKHVANHEAAIVYYNAILGKWIPVDYHAVPHAVFTAPEIAGVGIREKEAVERYGKDGIRIGFHRYEETTKGTAIAAENAFVKVIIEASTNRILGAHIIGPDASILIQEIVTVLYTSDATIRPVIRAMHIHPALSEVVQRACLAPVSPDRYHEMLREYRLSPDL